jgi:hypothetical protein
MTKSRLSRGEATPGPAKIILPAGVGTASRVRSSRRTPDCRTDDLENADALSSLAASLAQTPAAEREKIVQPGLGGRFLETVRPASPQ